MGRRCLPRRQCGRPDLAMRPEWQRPQLPRPRTGRTLNIGGHGESDTGSESPVPRRAARWWFAVKPCQCRFESARCSNFSAMACSRRSDLAQRLNLVRPLNASPIVPSGEVDLSRYCRCSPLYKVKMDPQPRIGSD